MRTQEPRLRMTRWQRRINSAGPRIPFEAECTACPDAQFKIKHDKRLESGFWAQPDLDRYTSMLQSQFEEHLKLVHPGERRSATAG